MHIIVLKPPMFKLDVKNTISITHLQYQMMCAGFVIPRLTFGIMVFSIF